MFARTIRSHYNSNMRKLAQVILALTFVMMAFSVPQAAQAEAPVSAPNFSTVAELIDAVNVLRATYGLAPTKPIPS